jgi:hypothetical protein
LVSAKNAWAADYSASVSAATTLGVANDNLKSAIRNLVQTVVKAFALAQNYPNPFNPTAVINYQLPATSTISLKLYDLLGREKMTLSEGSLQPGDYNATLDARGLAAGVYFYRLTANEIGGGQTNSYVETKKLMVLK